MKTYKDFNEAVKALKAATGSGRVLYFVNGRQVNAAEYRQVDAEPFIYRSGLEIHAEKEKATE